MKIQLFLNNNYQIKNKVASNSIIPRLQIRPQLTVDTVSFGHSETGTIEDFREIECVAGIAITLLISDNPIE